jgi:hypothetical protein
MKEMKNKLIGTADIKIEKMFEKMSKNGHTFILVRGKCDRTFLSAMFFGNAQDWIKDKKPGDVIKVSGPLTCQAMVSQTNINKQFVSINIFANDFELISTGNELDNSVINITNVAKVLDHTNKQAQEVNDEVDVPF